jgi:cytochrome oxidase Cu insertion factor (SCO1/SenC/PrrC family)
MMGGASAPCLANRWLISFSLLLVVGGCLVLEAHRRAELPMAAARQQPLAAAVTVEGVVEGDQPWGERLYPDDGSGQLLVFTYAARYR